VDVIKHVVTSNSPFPLSAIPPHIGQCLHIWSTLYRHIVYVMSPCMNSYLRDTDGKYMPKGVPRFLNRSKRMEDPWREKFIYLHDVRTWLASIMYNFTPLDRICQVCTCESQICCRVMTSNQTMHTLTVILLAESWKVKVIFSANKAHTSLTQLSAQG
jgi:hypothetical protein